MNHPERQDNIPQETAGTLDRRMDRRTALKWMFTAAASVPVLRNRLLAQDAPPANGYGADPDLLKTYKPGELWPLTFTEEQRRIATKLADIIIPADRHSPAASKVGVVEFLDEWVSAPYPRHRQDRTQILDGFAWLDRQAEKRFEMKFAELYPNHWRPICDEICSVQKAKPDNLAAARFFARFRDLTAGGFYTSPEGRKDLRYIGNVPMASWDGPPPEVLKHVGLMR
jgi:hypothetical protein